MSCHGEGATHHTGCDCYEAARTSEMNILKRERDRAVAELAEAREALGGQWFPSHRTTLPMALRALLLKYDDAIARNRRPRFKDSSP